MLYYLLKVLYNISSNTKNTRKGVNSMKFNFIEKKLQLDPEVRIYAEKKVGKLDKFFRS